ncbi:uncharacterized protein LOC6551360 [Drosophila erecta]|uniref:Uncharacterized protein n=1 Tax=Drosophila erecta TaxID=7220 RepID=B3NXC8_DROER|nr:uncharacterized protein LOC6551360 [Drosophila erecta]EDV47300.1 uncharacterized protein Dere_GG17720 [Drosophila erecta]
MHTLGLFILSLLGLVESYGPQPLVRNIIKVRASGFMPFESDLLLPLNILRQLQTHDRASRYIGQRPKPIVRPKVKQQIRLERVPPLREAKGVQLYNLIDDDGELLLNLKVHNDQKPLAPANYQEEKYQSRYQSYDSPWMPSKWRPTSEFPLGVTSSSPRPLPLHQYLGQSNNRIDQKTAKSRRQDMWPHK